MRKIFTVAAFALPLLAAAPVFAQQVPTGSAERGKQIYVKDGCWQCHGFGGQGGQGTGPRVADTPIEALMIQLRHPGGEMPAYEPVILSDQAVADIYAYLQTQPKVAAVKDIPLLSNR
jgi:mono/diheme cytochrome c family protein